MFKNFSIEFLKVIMDKGNKYGWLENNRGSYGINEKDVRKVIKIS